MVKYIALWSVKPGLKAQDIWKLWREKHTAWVKERCPELKKYVQNQIIEELPGGEIDFFGVTEMWFEDLESARRAINRMTGPPPDEFYTKCISTVRRVFAQEIEVKL